MVTWSGLAYGLLACVGLGAILLGAFMAFGGLWESTGALGEGWISDTTRKGLITVVAGFALMVASCVKVLG